MNTEYVRAVKSGKNEVKIIIKTKLGQYWIYPHTSKKITISCTVKTGTTFTFPKRETK